MSEFAMFYNLFGFMHACILHVLSVCLTREVSHAPFTQNLGPLYWASNIGVDQLIHFSFTGLNDAEPKNL